jgi:catechol 2,3-dioxygenase-like lactoylglutathione lyase family enzyme
MNLNQITLPSRDVEKAAAFYRLLGFRQIVKSHPRYARFECPEGGATFSLHQVQVRPQSSGVVVYFECSTLDETVDRLVQDGVAFTQMPQDERWLWREARLLDPDGNEICLYHAGENRRFPPWRLDQQPE